MTAVREVFGGCENTWVNNTKSFIGHAMGANSAEEGVDFIRQLSRQCGIPQTLEELNVPADAIPRMAKAALTVQRLLKNNPREVSCEDAVAIYKGASE